jgi:hypothetical protein
MASPTSLAMMQISMNIRCCFLDNSMCSCFITDTSSEAAIRSPVFK